MAVIKFLVDLDLNKNQLNNAVFQNLATAPSAPLDGQVYWDTALDILRVYSVAAGAWISFEGETNLSYTPTATDGTVHSDTGDDATVPLVTPTGGTNKAGLMSPGDKTKLDGVEALADVTDATNVNAAGATMNADTTLAGNAYFLDDDTMAANDATKVVSQQSLVAYIGTEIADALVGTLVYKGAYDASAGVPPTGGGILQGYTYAVTAAGNGSGFFTVPLAIGDMIIAEQDNPTTEAHWTEVNKNIPDIVDASETEKGIAELATQGETDTGTDDTRIVTPLKLKTNLGITATLGVSLVYERLLSETSTSIVVTHGIGRQFVQVQVFEVAANDLVICEVELTSTTTCTLKFNTATTTNQYRVVIIG